MLISILDQDLDPNPFYPHDLDTDAIVRLWAAGFTP